MASLLPGELLVYDYRPSDTELSKKSLTSLKVLQWNVERNYESEKIIATLKELDADIVMLQEIDIGCKRSGRRNHMEEVCQALGVKGAFLCEFIELDSPIRSERDAGGGVHGNAILTKYDVDFRVVEHQYHSFNWDRDGALLKEPRKGRRDTLSAIVSAPGLPPIQCYTVHLEVFTGILGRITSFSEVLQDASRHSKETPHQLIFGDLNTMAHSIARLSPKYACDRYRYLSLGQTESEWWDERLLGVHEKDGELNTALARAGFFAWVPWWLLKHVPFLYTLGSGFSVDTLRKARNPGFYDPWPTDKITLHNPAHFGLFKAKLDWTLVRCMSVTRRWIGNEDFKASDHAYLMVEVVPDNQEQINQGYELWKQRRNQWMGDKKLSLKSLIWMSLGVVLISVLWIRST